MTKQRINPLTLDGDDLSAYRRGFHDGNEGNYFPCMLPRGPYDAGYRDGQKYGDRKGRPWSLKELVRS